MIKNRCSQVVPEREISYSFSSVNDQILRGLFGGVAAAKHEQSVIRGPGTHGGGDDTVGLRISKQLCGLSHSY